MDFWDYKYINIPIDDDGVHELDSANDLEWFNVCGIKLTKEDIDNISPLRNCR